MFVLFVEWSYSYWDKIVSTRIYRGFIKIRLYILLFQFIVAVWCCCGTNCFIGCFYFVNLAAAKKTVALFQSEIWARIDFTPIEMSIYYDAAVIQKCRPPWFRSMLKRKILDWFSYRCSCHIFWSKANASSSVPWISYQHPFSCWIN